MTRLADLRARREQLLARCAGQRAELAQRIAELRGRGPRSAQAGAQGSAGGAGRQRLPWIALLWGAMLLGRAREVLSVLLFARSAVRLTVHAGQLLRGVAARRAPRPAHAAHAGPTPGARQAGRS
jgi:hypothetical protein